MGCAAAAAKREAASHAWAAMHTGPPVANGVHMVDAVTVANGVKHAKEVIQHLHGSGGGVVRKGVSEQDELVCIFLSRGVRVGCCGKHEQVLLQACMSHTLALLCRQRDPPGKCKPSRL